MGIRKLTVAERGESPQLRRPADAVSAFAFLHLAGFLEILQMLADGWDRDFEGLCELRGRRRAAHFEQSQEASVGFLVGNHEGEF